MKKGFLCILLSLLMILPLLTACNKEADLSGSEVSIYTLFTIAGEETSPEAIRKVELALNRILFYRLGVILDLQMVTEDEYDEFIEGKLAELEAYTKDKSNNPYAENVEKYPDVMTGDRVLEMLENGEDIVLKRPRVDAFLVRGYDNYYKLATDKKLAELDTRMDYEGKELKAQIHTTLRESAKINGKTYGIPINTGIGEYMQLVIDKELAETYGLNLDTIESLADLDAFLSAVAKDNSDVIPMMIDENDIPKGFNFIISTGFPALVSSTGEVIDAYTNVKLKEYFAMLAKYYAKGYIGDNADDSKRCAVRIEFGTEEEILAENDNKVICKEYSAPIATNENTLKNLFCIPASVNNDELMAIVNIINEINTNADLMNLLTYGVQKTHGMEEEDAHYELNDKNQVERFEKNPYIVNPDYIGNCFITYTLDGEDANKWEKLIEQNKIAIPSPTLGFSMTPVSFTYTDVIENEDGTTEKKTVTIYEPDYVAIVEEVVDKYYPGLMNGSFIASKEFDYAKFEEEYKEKFYNEVTASLDKAYANRLQINLTTDEIDKILNDENYADVRNELKAEASDAVYSEDVSNAESYFEELASKESSEESPEESSEDEISDDLSGTEPEESASDDSSAVSDEANSESDASEESSDVSSEEDSKIVITDEMLSEYREYANITEESIAARVDTKYNALVKTTAAETVKAMIGTPEYEKAFEELKDVNNPDSEYNISLNNQIANKVDEEINTTLTDKFVKPYTEALVAEINATLETKIDEFIADYVEKRRVTEAPADEDNSEPESSAASTSVVESSDIEVTDAESSDVVTSDIVTSDINSSDVADDSTDASESSDSAVSDDSTENSAIDEPTEEEPEESKDDFYKQIEEEVYIKIGYWEKSTVKPDDNSSSSSVTSHTSDSSETSDTSDVSDESNVDSSDETTANDSSDASASEEGTDSEDGEDEKNDPVEVITKPYPTWLDFVIKGKVAKAYYTLHPMQ